jgi:hypothetical protein
MTTTNTPVLSQLSIYPLRFTVEVQTPLKLVEPCGAQLRGALYTALWQEFCLRQDQPTCAACPLHCSCPVSALVAPLRDEALNDTTKGGRDLPRPYVIRPPQDVPPVYLPGQQFTFELLLFGQIINLLPYLVQVIPTLERAGLGPRLPENHFQRGRFRISRIENYHPFTGTSTTIYAEGRIHREAKPLAVTSEDVRQRAAQLPIDQLTIHFLTPLRLISAERLVHEPDFSALVSRLFKRLRDLEEAYSPGEQRAFTPEHHPYLAQARQISCLENATSWCERISYSRRREATSPMSGLIGHATFTGDLAPFRELLVWGELTQVGRSCVKGNGYYRIVTASP